MKWISNNLSIHNGCYVDTCVMELTLKRMVIEHQVIYNSVARQRIPSDMWWRRNYQNSLKSHENSPHRGFLRRNQSQKSPNNTPHITRNSRVSNFWTSCLLPLLLFQPGSLPSQNRLFCFRMSVPLLLRHLVSHTVLHSQRRAQKQKHSAVDPSSASHALHQG